MQYTVEGKLELYVAAYSSRPVLHVKESGNQSLEKSYALTFADAVARYGKDLKEENLVDAYKKAGLAFKGQLEQYFVVLKDDEVAGMLRRPTQTRGSRGSRGTYRGRPRGMGFRGGRGNDNSYRGSNPRGGQTQKRTFDQSYGVGASTGSGSGFGSGFGSGAGSSSNSWYNDGLRPNKNGRNDANSIAPDAISYYSQPGYMVPLGSLAMPGTQLAQPSHTLAQYVPVQQAQTQSQAQPQGTFQVQAQVHDQISSMNSNWN